MAADRAVGADRGDRPAEAAAHGGREPGRALDGASSPAGGEGAGVADAPAAGLGAADGASVVAVVDGVAAAAVPPVQTYPADLNFAHGVTWVPRGSAMLRLPGIGLSPYDPGGGATIPVIAGQGPCAAEGATLTVHIRAMLSSRGAGPKHGTNGNRISTPR